MQSSVSFDPTAQPTSDMAPKDASQPGRHSRFWVLPVIFLVMVGVLALTLALASPENQPLIGVVSQLLSTLFCLSCTAWMVVRAPRGRTRWAWLCLALAQFSYLTGDVLIIVLTLQNTPATSLSLADVFLLQLAPLTALGAILFPPTRSTAAKQFRVILDVCIAVGALFGLALVFLIVPRYTSGTNADYAFMAYPVVDFILLLVLIVLQVRGVQSTYQPVLFWLTVGMLCLIWADTSYNYLSLPEFHVGPSYTPGTFYVDPFWVAGTFAFSLAPLSLLLGYKPRPRSAWIRALTAQVARLQPHGSLSQFILLVVPVLALFGLILFSETFAEKEAARSLEVLTLAVVLLIIIRQMLTQHDLVDARIANERAQQLDSLKDQFITSVNHELRTPLMTMQGYIELLADPEAHATMEKRREMLERARGACSNLVHLVRSILDTRRIEAEAGDYLPEVVNVREAAQVALSLIDPREADPSGRHLRVQIPTDLAIWGHPVRVQQILTNLLSNAIKYSPPETPITVAAYLTADKGIHRRGWGGSRGTARQMVEIIVQDWGLGIPPDQKDLLFRRFVRLPREIASNVHGNGLGLFLCRVFAEAMGGTIWVESSGVAGEGSTFHVRLPVPPEHEQAGGATTEANGLQP